MFAHPFVLRHSRRRPAQQSRRLAAAAQCRFVPVGERLRPARLGIGEVRGTQHGDKDLRRRMHLVEGGQDPYEAITAVIPWERFRASVAEAETLARPEDFKP